MKIGIKLPTGLELQSLEKENLIELKKESIEVSNNLSEMRNTINGILAVKNLEEKHQIALKALKQHFGK